MTAVVPPVVPIVPIVPITSSDVEIATRAADHFTRIYYTTYDSDTRLNDLPQFYRPNSSLTWNGKPFQGVEGVRQLIEKMPSTKHEVLSFDCHPIPGTSPPSLMVTVSGNVTHGRGPAGNPPTTSSRNPEGQPRVFSQTFLLVPDPAAPATKPGELAKYYVSADALRFVG
ncbi:NTF2-related export protein 1 [Hypsizygus marmoreus]|uniref:NTF2-related export protein 1 n=1 Tax=Hypsizygus marmoreus TaxID=39966 RepID=A0A369K4J5_HYPMA|nr:NTF2-related export protein 1 [Hypsizygus marmoreus]